MSVALVVGCAECVWDDALRAAEMFEPDAIFAVKDMMVHWPYRIDYGITLHPDRTSGYLRARAAKGLSDKFPVWAHKAGAPFNGVPHLATSDWAGSSGLFGVKVALQEGFDAVVVAGVPMMRQAGHIARKKDWISADMFRRGWKVRLEVLKPKVRSMSGWTRELLGEPTPEWLALFGSAPPKPELVRVLTEKADGQSKDSAGKLGRRSGEPA